MKHENEEILHSFSLGDLGKKGILLAFEYFEVPHKGLYLKYCKHWLHSLAYTYKLCNFSLKEYHTSKPKILYINCTNFHYCPDSPIDPPKKSKVYDSFECLQYLRCITLVPKRMDGDKHSLFCPTWKYKISPQGLFRCIKGWLSQATRRVAIRALFCDICLYFGQYGSPGLLQNQT